MTNNFSHPVPVPDDVVRRLQAEKRVNRSNYVALMGNSQRMPSRLAGRTDGGGVGTLLNHERRPLSHLHQLPVRRFCGAQREGGGMRSNPAEQDRVLENYGKMDL